MNQLSPLRWIPSGADSLLDVGCNVGELLADCGRRWPRMRLAGVDVNSSAVGKAQQMLPYADVRRLTGTVLPFPSESFDCVTCIEVIEHIPESDRGKAMDEIWRVLKPGGTFVLRCPHLGAFAWLDSNNFRFRFPAVYRMLVGRGLRDSGYANDSDGVVWHQHFTRGQLLQLVGEHRFKVETTRYGGLLLFPAGDILRWPFYRKGLLGHPVLRVIDKVMEWDASMPYGRAGYTILLRLRKQH